MERTYDLPIVVISINRDLWDQEYTIDKVYKLDEVKAWYESMGIQILKIKHIAPSLGPERDEIEARLPDEWKEVSADANGNQTPWVYVLNENGEKMFSMFVKKAPWDYCFFAKPN